ncbi:MAG: hypothetical protein ABSH20_03635 [Tepidisphaeraceae bacterium]
MRNIIGLMAVVCGLMVALAARGQLPAESLPAGLEAPHFPDRIHTFVWRNWNLVESERMGRVLGTSAENVRAVAGAMGLPAEVAITPQMKSRLYLTVIRRNWHLLPFDQLLALLEMSPEQLAETLREDDFLWIKLGSRKPKCDRLVYIAPGPDTKKREAEIAALVQKEFGAQLSLPAEPRLGFLAKLTGTVATPVTSDNQGGLRFLYSYFAVFGDPLLDPSLDPYPDALLQQLADRCVNGVWLHVVLRQLAPGGEFPEFGKGHEQRLENLRVLVQRAKRFGIGVYLYMNEPRAMPESFFKDRQEMAGVREGDHIAMCTSDPRVRKWLSDSLAHVFTNVPDLAGVFTITASENLTNCTSHGQARGCVRCQKREPADIIAEVNAAIESGVHRGNPNARVLVWDWGWTDAWAPQIIRQLPKSVWLMSVSEWSLPISRGGVNTSVGEYSLSAVGPGPRATRHWALAKEAGLKCVAKVQLNNSWELSAVPYLPVMDLVAEHCSRLSWAGVDGTMLSWSLGGYPSPNLRLASLLARRPVPSKDQALDTIARERFGPDGAAHVRKAWTLFSRAFAEYPFDVGVIYSSPVQMGPANLLYGKPTGFAATMVGFPYDDVKRWSGPYPPAVLAGQFEKVAAGWKEAMVEMEQAAAAAPKEFVEEARREASLARAAGLHFRSVANQVRFVVARDALADKATVAAERPRLKLEFRRLLEDEQACARELFDLARQDSRIGFEASNHYYYVPQDLIEKVINCRYLATN